MPDRRRMLAPVALLCLLLRSASAQEAPRGPDRLHDLQDEYVTNKDEKTARAYHFGSQGAGDVFSNHASHSNRLIPVYVFGTKADLGSITGANSRYRDRSKIEELYGTLPEHTLNPEAEYADQSDLYRLQREAVERGAKYLFIVWFDGLDWPTTRAAAIAKTGTVYDEGKGSGLIFQDYDGTPVQFGYVVTSPTHDKNDVDVDAQTVTIPENSLLGGYDARIAGPNPWTDGPLDAPGYLKGQSATKAERARVEEVGGVLHAYTDSSTSAAEAASGVKSYNNGVNVAEDGRFVPTLFNQLQEKGWKAGTATSVPFDHASPAAMYAHNVHRDDYQDLARDMLGLEGIGQQTGKDPRHPGLDVVIGGGFGVVPRDRTLKGQGENADVESNTYLADRDREAIRVENGGPYVVAERTVGAEGAKVLLDAADRAAEGGHKLFGLFGGVGGHLPYRTADGDYRPARGIRGTAESYTPADLTENPTLADMTRAALRVLSAEEGKPFALFVEAGDVDFGLHDNNLDNAVGALYSGEEAIRVITDWVERNSNWDESVLIVTADHGHYLVIDDPEAIAGAAKGK
jgi:alkaline phosphatase